MEINKYIDHTALKPETTHADIIKLCEEAATYNFASVCINPTWVATAAQALAQAKVEICTVIGFPLGANTSATKAFETKDAIKNGATEIDMVLNIGALKSGDIDVVTADIAAVVEAASGKLVKVIIETCLLTDAEKVLACNAAVEGGACFVKTSTGFSTGGATIADVELMKRTVGDTVAVKASGGVRNKDDVMAMIQAGATRIGTSNGHAIMVGLEILAGTY
ncbi:deoxyribose-phosphate aldolase [Erysipelotrichaceae bacterium]|nr:deoxyribose-phosphate aldolase [Erysipelotrichaceae bacterium]